MRRNIIALADGENLVLRYQKMMSDGAEQREDVVHSKDLLIWHGGITGFSSWDVVRVNFYQTVVGDENKLNASKQIIQETRYDYGFSGNGFGFLYPKIFKKSGRSVKTKSVDINLTIDMLRYAALDRIDEVVLLSGDGDYLPLIEEVMRMGKKLYLGAFSDGLNRQLKCAADEFIDLDNLFFR